MISIISHQEPAVASEPVSLHHRHPVPQVLWLTLRDIQVETKCEVQRPERTVPVAY